MVLEIGQAGFSGDGSASKATGLYQRISNQCEQVIKGNAYRASSQLVCLPIMRLVVSRLPIAHHGHNKRKLGTRTVILVGIEEDSKSLKVIRRAKHGSLRSALLGEP